MSKRVFTAGLAALALVTSIGLASAETPAAFMKKVDKDKDGTLSLDEVKSFAADRFKALEKDSDGTLDLKELKGRLSASGFKSANSDADKTIDEPEFMAYVEKLYNEADDGDKTLDVKELGKPSGKKLIMLLH